MGASSWAYLAPYRGDVAAALRELRERVFRDRDYVWWDELEDSGPRPETIEGIWESEEMRYDGTHSILDVAEVVQVPAADWREHAHGTVRPLAPDRAREAFGTARPSPAQFQAIADDPRSPGYRAMMDALPGRWAGYYILLYDDATPTHVGFWGSSGD